MQHPYVTSILVAQRQADLVQSARESRTTGTARRSVPGPGLFARLRDAVAGAWSLAAAGEATTPALRDYPFTARP